MFTWKKVEGKTLSYPSLTYKEAVLNVTHSLGYICREPRWSNTIELRARFIIMENFSECGICACGELLLHINTLDELRILFMDGFIDMSLELLYSMRIDFWCCYFAIFLGVYDTLRWRRHESQGDRYPRILSSEAAQCHFSLGPKFKFGVVIEKLEECGPNYTRRKKQVFTRLRIREWKHFVHTSLEGIHM